MGKKRVAFKLTHREPFPVECENGTYEIPPLDRLAYEDWADVASLRDDTDTKQMLEIYKSFFIRICPGLAQEDIGDNQWLILGTAYLEAMGE